MRYARAKTKLFLSMILMAGFFHLVSPPIGQAQIGTLAEPFSPPTPNAALHYQRALLLMSALDQPDHELLQKDVWEVLPGFDTLKLR